MRLFRRISVNAAVVFRRVTLGTVLAALAVTCSALSAQAELRQAPNSRVAIDLDARFVPSDRFSGFTDEQSGASFVIVEMPPQAYNELKHIGDSPEALATRGLTDAQKKDLAGRDGEYVYLTAKQSADGTEVAKHILIFRQNRATVMITANIPQKALDNGVFAPGQVERTLAAATVMDQVARQEALFRLSYLGPFKDSFGLAGTSKAYTPSGRTPAAGENLAIAEPILIVSPSLDHRPVPDPKSAAHRAFTSFGGLTEKTISSEKEITISGLKGYQIIGEANEQTSGAKLAVHFVLLAGDPNGYYALFATCPAGDAAKFMPEIDRVIASFEPVKPK
jgi:hypothetical protein